MFDRIFLQNFRNHRETEISFSRNLTIFCGENGAGKTSILEAIYALFFGKSFRAKKREDFIKFNENFARIRGEKNEISHEIFFEISPRERTIFRKN